MADIRIIPAIGAINVTGSADFRGTGASSVLFVSGSGNVGIGTSTPNSKLHVAGAIKATALTGHMFGDGTDTTRAISILDSNLSQGSTRVITLGRSNSNNNQAEIGFYLDQTGSAANRLSLGLYNSSTTLNVLGSGGVGIGTVSGLTTAANSAKLEVYDTVSRGAGGGTIRVTSTANSQTVLALKNTTSGKTWEMSVGGTNNTEVPGGFYIYEAGVTSRLVITGSNGNVGIGTIVPLGKLHVKGGGGNGTLYIEGTSYVSHFNYGTNEDTYIRPGKTAGHVIIADVGSNVGIGTASPRSKLHVAGAGNSAGGNIIIGNHSDGEGKWSFITSTHYSSSQEPEGFSLIGGYTTATKNAVVIGGNIYESNPSTEIQFWTHTATTHSLGGTQKMNINSVGQVRFNTYGSATHTGTAAYRLSVDSSGNLIEESLGAGAVDGLGASNYLARWEDTDTLTSSSIYQDANGNIGIGTITPSRTLDVNGDIQNNGVLRRSGYVYIKNDGSTTKIGPGNPTAGDITFHSSATLTSGDQLVVIKSDGNLGVGTTAPTAKLDIYQSGSTALNIAGSQGQLFSVTDDLSGSLMSVNDISGIPILEVFSDDRVVAGQFGTNALVVNGANVGVGLADPAYRLDVTGSMHVQSGPSGTVYFGNSTNNYLSYYNSDAYFKVTGKLYFEDSGFYKGAWDGNGNLGVGTTNPTAPLEIYGQGALNYRHIYVNSNEAIGGGITLQASASNAYSLIATGPSATQGASKLLVYRDATDGNSTTAVFDASGNVGIGLTNPIGKLNINTGTSGVSVDVANQSSGTISFANGSGGTAVPNIVAKSSNNVGLNVIAATPDVPAAGVDMQFYVQENDGTDFATTTSTAFRFGRYTTPLFNILRNGNVGIGTTEPSNKLDVNGDVIFRDGLVVKYNNNTGEISTPYAPLLINGPSAQSVTFDEENTTATLVLRGYQDNVNLQLGTGGSSLGAYGGWIQASYDNVSISGSEPLLLNPIGGNVGIGTTSPSAKLYIDGGGATDTEKVIVSGNDAIIRLGGANTNGPHGLQFGYDEGVGSDGMSMYYRTGPEHIVFENSTGTNGTGVMVIQRTGNVGIGNTTPQNQLAVGPQRHYSPDDTNRILNWYAATDGTEIGNSGIEISVGNYSGDTTQPKAIGLALYNNYSGSESYSPAITFGGLSVSEGYMNGSAAIAAQLFTNPDDNNFKAGDLTFYTQGTTTATRGLTEKMRITSAGDVGINTPAPLRTLHVAGDFAVNASGSQYYGVYINGAGEGADPNILIGDWHNASANLTWDSSARALIIDTQYSTGAGTFKITGNDQASTFFTIDTNGDVTITNDLTVDGIITAKEFHTTFVSASIIYQSGSTQFGDTADDIHEFNGKIGINTGTPETALHVIGDIGAGSGYNGGFYATSNTTNVDQNWGFDFSKTTSVDDYATRIKFYPEAGSTRKMGFYDERSDAWLGYFDGSVNSNLNFIFSSGGRVGIGETAPSYPLHVIGKIYSTTEVQGGSAFMNDTGGISVFGSNTSTRSIRIGRDGVTSDIFISGSNGRVGIGTNYPYAPLHVYQGVGTAELSTFSNYTSGGRVQLGFQQNDSDGLHHRVYLRGEKDANGTYGGRFDLYVRQHSTANQLQALTVRSDGNVGIGSASPAAKLDVNGTFKASELNVDNTIVFNSKTMTMTNTFADALTVNMNAHTGCYVKITAFGDWGSHSSISYLGEFFLQNGNSAYNEPGRIIRQVDNTYTDHIEAQIVDPGSSGTRDFVIQLRATATASFTAYLQYEVRGLFNSVS